MKNQRKNAGNGLESARTARLGMLGARLDGSAAGAMLAEFVLRCRADGVVPVLNFAGVERVSGVFVDEALRHYDDFAPRDSHLHGAVETAAENIRTGRELLEELLNGFAEPPRKSVFDR